MATARTKIKRNDIVELPTATAITTSGIEVDFNGHDDRTLLILTSSASSAVTVTVLNGTGIQATGDYTYSVGAGKTVALVVESMKFKDMSTGNIKIKASATGVTVQAVEV